MTLPRLFLAALVALSAIFHMWVECGCLVFMLVIAAILPDDYFSSFEDTPEDDAE